MVVVLDLSAVLIGFTSQCIDTGHSISWEMAALLRFTLTKCYASTQPSTQITIRSSKSTKEISIEILRWSDRCSAIHSKALTKWQSNRHQTKPFPWNYTQRHKYNNWMEARSERHNGDNYSHHNVHILMALGNGFQCEPKPHNVHIPNFPHFHISTLRLVLFSPFSIYQFPLSSTNVNSHTKSHLFTTIKVYAHFHSDGCYLMFFLPWQSVRFFSSNSEIMITFSQ